MPPEQGVRYGRLEEVKKCEVATLGKPYVLFSAGDMARSNSNPVSRSFDLWIGGINRPFVSLAELHKWVLSTSFPFCDSRFRAIQPFLTLYTNVTAGSFPIGRDIQIRGYPEDLSAIEVTFIAERKHQLNGIINHCLKISTF